MSHRFSEVESGVRVRLSFGGSQSLRVQIAEGARADIFASANMHHIEALQSAGHIAGAQSFARGSLVLVLSRENLAGIHRFSDLPRATRVVLGTDASPIGAYTQRCLQRANQAYGADFMTRVTERVVSRESNARLVRAKVEMGEADAAIVYRSDALGRAALKVVELPDSVAIEALYVQGLVLRGESSELAQRWVHFVRSDVGREIMREHGFEELM